MINKISSVVFALLLASCATTKCLTLEAQREQQDSLESRSLASQGIVVPKRTALIVGLNQQFKLRATDNKPASNISASLWPLSRLQARRPLGPSALAAIGSGGASSSSSILQPANQQGLYLDRHQQEILAANPNLLNPSSLPTGANLITRSAADQAPTSFGHFHQQQQQQQQHQRAALNPNSNPNESQARQQMAEADSGTGQQLYRGYSLIELDVKSESDRRFIQDLYGNLSAALNEQAQNPHALTVSPYVDVDFWSFGRQALNDQIDIMVSPKSRSFLVGQLNRAKIRHRIKIDDIQARLDQQQQQLAGHEPAMASGLSQPSSSSSSSDMKRIAYVDSLSGRAGNPTHDTASSPSVAAAGLNGRQSGGQQSSKPMNDSQFFENYQRLADMSQWLESLVERNRGIGQIKVIGRSSQGRYLRVLKLGYDQQDSQPDSGSSSLAAAAASNLFSSDDARNQPVSATNASSILDSFFRKQAATKKLGSIWLDGGTHAREWISPSTVLYIAFRLSDNHNRCYHFFESLKAAASATAFDKQHSSDSQTRQAKRYAAAPSVDQSLVNGINEINTSLLGGKPVKQNRPRTEFERTLELLAKSPQEVASEHGCDLDMDQLLRRYTFFMMPVLNPDGYEYSHTHNRLWRKTRSTSNHPIYRHFCLGADPNRNYDARHGATGSSTHPCSQTFAGSVPFTEPETRHHSNFVYANRLGMKMYISFHSYSQMILLPYSHSKQFAPDHKDLESVGLAAAKAIEQTHGTVYRVGASASILYTASGTASDWAYEKAGIKYSYTMELRDTGAYGFLLPRQQIVPTGEETFNGLLAMINQMEKNDNLLTSKSSSSNIFGAASDGLASNYSTSSQPEELNHVPNMDDLGGSWKKHSNSRPGAQLESVLDGGWSPSASSGHLGVRDRKQPIGADQPSAHSGDHLLALDEGEEVIDTSDNEPDAGYAFEGEGELMEPTNSQSDIEHEHAHEHLQMRSNRRLASAYDVHPQPRSTTVVDQRRAISRSAGLSPSGRNYINSPLMAPSLHHQSDTSTGRRRESSADLVGFGRATVAL